MLALFTLVHTNTAFYLDKYFFFRSLLTVINWNISNEASAVTELCMLGTSDSSIRHSAIFLLCGI